MTGGRDVMNIGPLGELKICRERNVFNWNVFIQIETVALKAVPAVGLSEEGILDRLSVTDYQH